MPKDYTTYTVAEFLTDDDFVTYHLKPTTESQQFWETWVNTHSATAYHQAVEILQSIRLGLRTYENTTLSTEVKLFIFSRIQQTNQRSVLGQSPKTMAWLAAASIIILVGLGFYFFQSTSAYTKNLAVIENRRIEEKNNQRKPMLIHLSDGSAVKLAPQSKISYPAQFAKDKRMVILAGEATFDIAKDPTRPFYVIANEVTTKVLGTRFNVKAYENRNDVVVSVEEGKVSVFKNIKVSTPDKALTGVVLLPNQQVVFDRTTDQYDKKLIQVPSLLHHDAHVSFDFDETPLKEVIQRIEIAYGIEIMYDEVLLSDCQVTGRFENESLFQKLDIITKIIGGSYELVEGKVLINSRGCH